MDLLKRVKDIGIKFTYYVGGRAFDPNKQKRTTALEDIKKKRAEKRLKEDYELYKEGL